ncbi:Hypothetical protein [Arabidopsis thaliana]|uniref:At1g18760 n=2 Tax=Arabidopsis thaliana TaxID=3702 RepID=Q9M9U7_ARATH|nr:Zinc finger, C3HC4 type (RING finger) family protein [Arabidopsis thaliana]AAF27103.1 Hypothetical protein [Arabidopsis thaliana]AAZ14054.1 At1g18760 [Arabidopsis thaliana]AEE29760.1 Zinc finger, C3HC4 type (RING finger) family protein [Arabidopsis thaliana]CAD5313112.1 unnamed protein product [Arabidopsis thaliana]|eukprot:NP_173311.1 Zinc finger, C3HC4 type (RING finger) family protein [Arabidopsis thaliana]
MRIDFYHNIIRNHQPENAGTLSVNANIDGYDYTFTDTSFIEEFLNEENNQFPTKQKLHYFLEDSELINDYDMEWGTAIFELIFYVVAVTNPARGDYSPGDDLLVSLLIFPNDEPIEEEYEIEEEDLSEEEDQIEEAVRASLEETNNISLRPANKLVVNSLARKIYKKTTSSTERCTICLEEFNDGTKVMTLPCGHEFDDECVLTWFETNHDCPLCRFKLPCEDQ